MQLSINTCEFFIRHPEETAGCESERAARRDAAVERLAETGRVPNQPHEEQLWLRHCGFAQFPSRTHRETTRHTEEDSDRDALEDVEEESFPVSVTSSAIAKLRCGAKYGALTFAERASLLGVLVRGVAQTRIIGLASDARRAALPAEADSEQADAVEQLACDRLARREQLEQHARHTLADPDDLAALKRVSEKFADVPTHTHTGDPRTSLVLSFLFLLES